MRSSIRFVFLAAFGIALVACQDVNITNGQIPSEYLEQARSITGSYVSQNSSGPQSIEISLEGDRLVMRAIPDMVGSGCDSRIGNLLKVRMGGNSNNYYVESAHFDFSANLCAATIQGHDLAVSLRNQNGRAVLSTSLLASSVMQQECHLECTGMPVPGCHDVCQWVNHSEYIQGKFVKMN